jgi:fucose 4-O-acetylase-like acetyltransferase
VVPETRRGAWSRAAQLAARTPESRNRYVDFLRAVSILAVVTGHWLMAAPSLEGGSPRIDHILDLTPWTRWLTWLFQVMPVFFFVGGFSNGVSWRAALRSGRAYREWLDARLRRLLGPVLPLIAAWAVIASLAQSRGVSPELVKQGSRTALVPIWFLAVYILVVLLVPCTLRAWERFGYLSVAALAALAAVVDALFFAASLHAVGWLNYLFVWLAVHQLGYAWLDGRFRGPSRSLPWLAAGLLLLFLLILLGPYPLSLVGVPGDEISNTLPPKIPLLALAAAQIGLLLAVESPFRRWLARRAPWTATVLVNGMIMTIFLWHSTVMILGVALAFWLFPALLHPTPASAAWWATRPAWLTAYALGSVPFLAVFARFERWGSAGTPERVWRQLLGCFIACAGLSLLALDGVAGTGWLGLRPIPLLLPFLGAALAGFAPLRRPGPPGSAEA